MNSIKYSILASLFIICHLGLHAQAPCWYEQPPTCKDDSFEYMAGRGKDKNEAIIDALTSYLFAYSGITFKDTTFKAYVENGLEIIEISSTPVLSCKKREKYDEQKDVVYILLLFHKLFPKEEDRRFVIYPNENLCDSIQRSPSPPPPPYISVSKPEKFSSGIGYQTVNIETNGKDWSCLEIPDWLSAQKDSNKLILESNKNIIDKRSANITVRFLLLKKIIS